MKQGYEVRCVKCQQLKWPYLLDKPQNYECTLCRAGVTGNASPRQKAALDKARAVKVAKRLANSVERSTE